MKREWLNRLNRLLSVCLSVCVRIRDGSLLADVYTDMQYVRQRRKTEKLTQAFRQHDIISTNFQHQNYKTDFNTHSTKYMKLV